MARSDIFFSDNSHFYTSSLVVIETKQMLRFTMRETLATDCIFHDNRMKNGDDIAHCATNKGDNT